MQDENMFESQKATLHRKLLQQIESLPLPKMNFQLSESSINCDRLCAALHIQRHLLLNLCIPLHQKCLSILHSIPRSLYDQQPSMQEIILKCAYSLLNKLLPMPLSLYPCSAVTNEIEQWNLWQPLLRINEEIVFYFLIVAAKEELLDQDYENATQLIKILCRYVLEHVRNKNSTRKQKIFVLLQIYAGSKAIKKINHLNVGLLSNQIEKAVYTLLYQIGAEYLQKTSLQYKNIQLSSTIIQCIIQKIQNCVKPYDQNIVFETNYFKKSHAQEKNNKQQSFIIKQKQTQIVNALFEKKKNIESTSIKQIKDKHQNIIQKKLKYNSLPHKNLFLIRKKNKSQMKFNQLNKLQQQNKSINKNLKNCCIEKNDNKKKQKKNTLNTKQLKFNKNVIQNKICNNMFINRERKTPSQNIFKRMKSNYKTQQSQNYQKIKKTVVQSNLIRDMFLCYPPNNPRIERQQFDVQIIPKEQLESSHKSIVSFQPKNNQQKRKSRRLSKRRLSSKNLAQAFYQQIIKREKKQKDIIIPKQIYLRLQLYLKAIVQHSYHFQNKKKSNYFYSLIKNIDFVYNIWFKGEIFKIQQISQQNFKLRLKIKNNGYYLINVIDLYKDSVQELQNVFKKKQKNQLILCAKSLINISTIINIIQVNCKDKTQNYFKRIQQKQIQRICHTSLQFDEVYYFEMMIKLTITNIAFKNIKSTIDFCEKYIFENKFQDPTKYFSNVFKQKTKMQTNTNELTRNKSELFICKKLTEQQLFFIQISCKIKSRYFYLQIHCYNYNQNCYLLINTKKTFRLRIFNTLIVLKKCQNTNRFFKKFELLSKLQQISSLSSLAAFLQPYYSQSKWTHLMNNKCMFQTQTAKIVIKGGKKNKFILISIQIVFQDYILLRVENANHRYFLTIYINQLWNLINKNNNSIILAVLKMRKPNRSINPKKTFAQLVRNLKSTNIIIDQNKISIGNTSLKLIQYEYCWNMTIQKNICWCFKIYSKVISLFVNLNKSLIVKSWNVNYQQNMIKQSQNIINSKFQQKIDCSKKKHIGQVNIQTKSFVTKKATATKEIFYQSLLKQIQIRKTKHIMISNCKILNIQCKSKTIEISSLQINQKVSLRIDPNQNIYFGCLKEVLNIELIKKSKFRYRFQKLINQKIFQQLQKTQ